MPSPKLPFSFSFVFVRYLIGMKWAMNIPLSLHLMQLLDSEVCPLPLSPNSLYIHVCLYMTEQENSYLVMYPFIWGSP
jgi:hypothetical protein